MILTSWWKYTKFTISAGKSVGSEKKAWWKSYVKDISLQWLFCDGFSIQKIPDKSRQCCHSSCCQFGRSSNIGNSLLLCQSLAQLGSRSKPDSDPPAWVSIKKITKEYNPVKFIQLLNGVKIGVQYSDAISFRNSKNQVIVM